MDERSAAPNPRRLSTVLSEAGYRTPTRVAALDGLRAVAVVAVVVYHLDLSLFGVRMFRGGFVGVDLFFVLSGYLIGSLIVEEVRRTGRVALLAFWGRRFRRLMPASLTLLVCVVVWGATVGWNRDVEGDVLGSLFWFQNWHLITTDQPYIDQFVSPSPLNHFWSLSIEEQWYLAFPLLAFAGRRWIRRATPIAALVLLVAAAGSVALMAVHFSSSATPWRAYFGTDSRVFALLIGCAASMLPATRNALAEPHRRRQWSGLMLLGLVALLAISLTVSEQGRYMYLGGFALVAAASALAVVGAARSRVRWFDAAVVQWLGTRSYGIYLWHWPVLVALDAERLGFDGAPLVVARLAVVAAATELSYRLVETPVRMSRGRLALPRISLATGVVASGCLALAVITIPQQIDRGTSAEVLRAAQEATAAPPVDSDPAAPGDELTALVVGDSVAFGLGFVPAGFDDGIGGRLEIDNGALPGCGLTRLPRPNSTFLVGEELERCLDLAGRWRQLLTSDPDVVVWVVGPFDSVDVLDGDVVVEPEDPRWRALITTQLQESFDVLTSTSVSLVVVLPPCRDEVVTTVEGLTPSSVSTLVAVIADIATDRQPLVRIEDPSGWQCPPDGPRNRTPDGEEILDDGLHYTADGKRAFWQWLAPLLDAPIGDSAT